jgi:hypothetical protein
MKEMTKAERRALWLKYLRYKWEFTRRNEEYRREYEDYKATDDEGEKVGKQIAMAEKWGFAVDPDNKEPYLLWADLGFPGNLKIIKSPITEYMIDNGDISMGGTVSLIGKLDKELVISINLEGPDWLTVSSLENLLRVYRFSWKIKEKRISWDMFEGYLRIFDLYKEGKSIGDIAKEVYPNDFKKAENEGNMPSLIRRVKRNLMKATKAIYSGQIS